MPPNVKILGRAFSDPRFRLMGKLMGSDEFSALGRMAYLWQFCTERQTYILPEKLVEMVVDVEAMVVADLGERVEGGIRIRGAEGKIEWFGRLQESGRNAALKRWGAHSADRLPIGHLPKPNGSPIGGPKEGEGEVDLSLSESEGESAERGNGSTAALVRKTTTSVIEAFNNAFNRKLSPKGWDESVKKLIAKGFTDAEMRGVVWWAANEWADDPDMRAKVTPKTLLKLQSAQGYRTFREYLSCAGELWRNTHGGEIPPWENETGGPVP